MAPMLFTLTGLLMLSMLAALIATCGSRRRVGVGFSLAYIFQRIAKQDRGVARLAWIVAIGALALGAAILAAASQGVLA